MPQEVSESEAFPKEELSSTQYEADMAEPRERPTSEFMQQGEQRLKLPGNCVPCLSGALFNMMLVSGMLLCHWFVKAIASTSEIYYYKT